jgi:diguanylate cyclase (GGDEF)-like protein/PAS domain S-box-containing protein
MAAVRSRQVIAAAVATLLYAAVLTVRFAVDDPREAVSLLYVLPIAVLGLEMGITGGLAGATLSTLLFVYWHAAADVPVTVLGVLLRIIPFYLVGGVVGRMAASSRALAAAYARQWNLSLDLMCTADFEGHFRRVNPAFERLLGYSAAELTARPLLDFVHPEDRERTATEAARLAAGAEGTLDFQNRYLAADGGVYWLEWRATVVREEGLVYAMARDVTDRKRLEEELREVARHDALTGLLNRRGFLGALAAHLAQVRRYPSTTALLALDLDGFKAVNDRFGHAAGDDILVQVAQCVRESLREADVAGRLGGDELLVLLPHTGADSAQTAAARLVGAIAERLRQRRVTASVGVAVFPAGATIDEDAWLAAADRAMYEAKRAGGNRCVVAEAG